MRVLVWVAVSSKAQTAREKMSLPDQEARGLQWAASVQGYVTDILRVPGHSRRYTSLRDVAEAAGRKGIDAFARLEKHLESCDFDVLWMRDADRIGRTQALVAEVTERLINCGARIYSDNDGWIDSSNFRMWIAMAGYKAAASVDGFVKARQATFIELLNSGMRPVGKMPLSHRYIYSSQTGKRTAIVVRDELRTLFDDLGALLLAGVSWRQIDHALYRDFGHAHASGKPYWQGAMYVAVMNPVFWGHVAFGYSSDNGGLRGAWIYDESQPAPESVLVKRDTHEAVYAGDYRLQVQAELNRRATVIKGRTRPTNTHRFAGLLVCGGCGYTMTATSSKKAGKAYYTMRCPTSYNKHLSACHAPEYLSAGRVQNQLDLLLKRLLDNASIEAAFQAAQPDTGAPLERTRAAVEETERQIRNLIAAQARAPENAIEMYQDEIAVRTNQLTALKRELRSQETRQLQQQRTAEAARVGIEALREITINGLWQLSDREINQKLLAIFGDYQIVVRGKELADIQPRRGMA